MVKFSPAGSYMFIRQEPTGLVFICPKTNYTELAKPDDYHLFHKDYTIKTTDTVDYQSNLAVLCEDITVPKTKLDCPNCKKERVISQIRNKDYSVTNICCTCKSFWKL